MPLGHCQIPPFKFALRGLQISKYLLTSDIGNGIQLSTVLSMQHMIVFPHDNECTMQYINCESITEHVLNSMK